MDPEAGGEVGVKNCDGNIPILQIRKLSSRKGSDRPTVVHLISSGVSIGAQVCQAPKPMGFSCLYHVPLQFCARALDWP